VRGGEAPRITVNQERKAEALRKSTQQI